MTSASAATRLTELPASAPGRRARWLQAALCLALAFLFLWPISPAVKPYTGNDSAVFLYMGNAMLHGSVPYRDLWDHKPPLIFALNALSFVLTPGSLWGIFLIQVLFLAAANWILWDLFYHRIPPAGLIPLLLLMDLSSLRLSAGGNLTTFYPLPLQLAACWLLDRRRLSDQPLRTGLWMGALFGAVVLIRPTSAGLFAAFGLVVLINNLPGSLRNWLRFFAGLAAGGLLIGLPFLAYFACQHALPDLWNQVYVFNRFYSAAKNISDQINVLKTGSSYLLAGGLFPLALLGLGCLVWRWLRDRKLSPLRQMALLGFFIDWALVALGGRAKIPYYLTLVPVFILLAATAVEVTLPYLKRRPVILLLSAACILWIGFSFAAVLHQTVSQGRVSREYEGRVVAYVDAHTTPDQTIVVWGTDDWIYLHANRRAAVKMTYVNPLYFVGYVNDKILTGYYQSVLDARPALILSTLPDGSISDGFGDNVSKRSTELAAQIRSAYQVDTVIGECTIYRRIQP